jgi:hypothetical protein
MVRFLMYPGVEEKKYALLSVPQAESPNAEIAMLSQMQRKENSSIR